MATIALVCILFIIIAGISCQGIPTENPIGADGTVAGNLGNGSSETCRSGTTQLCQPNVYIAPTINCSTVEILTEFNKLRQEVTQLNDRVQRLTDHVGSSSPGTISRGCHEMYKNGNRRSGVYTIQPSYMSWPFRVYCDMDTDGGGWTVFQRRLNGSENFYRTWASYRRGFGALEGEFWLGNDNIHHITALDEFELRIDMEDFEGVSQFVTYGYFYIETYENNYRLHVDQFSGAVGDSLSFSNNQQFTTKDRDNDVISSANCAVRYEGAWWYKDCMRAHLNGQYLGGQTEIAWNGVIWNTWKGSNYSLKTAEMKIRPVTED